MSGVLQLNTQGSVGVTFGSIEVFIASSDNATLRVYEREIVAAAALLFLRYPAGEKWPLIGIGKIRNRKPRPLTVISEDDAVALAGRKCKQACTRRRGIANLGTLADAVCTIFPMMKRAADRFTLDIPNREVCAEVRAVRAHHVRDSRRPPIGDYSPAGGNRPLQFRPREFRATDE
jgi:hypothetical protein